jgi:putative tricarboxylic transport membrane protein
MNEAFLQACQQVFLNPSVWLVIVLAAIYGVFVGATPGLTATMAVALFVPLSYWLSDVAAIAAIVTVVACAIFAGDIPTALLRIPGTPASAAYADDAYAFTRRGQADRVLGVALVSSVLGGLFGAVVLMLLGTLLAPVATWFGGPEYFWLYLLGLSCAVLVSRRSTLKTMLALLLGLLLSTVGLSAVHTQARFTFGRPELYQGINFIPAMIGLFGLSEVLNNLVTLSPSSESSQPTPPSPAPPGRGAGVLARSLRGVFGPALEFIPQRVGPFCRSSSIGALIGMLPGAGADIAAWVSLAVSRRLQKSASPNQATLPETEPRPRKRWLLNTLKTAIRQPRNLLFRKQEGIRPAITTQTQAVDQPEQSPSLGGISDATAANSAALAGGWIPTLVFGIPGDSVTAIVIGVLMMKNVKPGPDIFDNQPHFLYSIYLLFLLANLVLLPVGWLAIRAGSLVIRTPRRVLLAVIVLFCLVGSYALNASYFDVLTMASMGLVGFALERWRVPLGPVVLGLILGGPLEERFIQTLTAGNASPLAFFNRPLAALLGVICLVLWGLTLTWSLRGGEES